MDDELIEEEECFFVDGSSPDNKWITVFEDNRETGYIYLCSCKEDGEFDRIIDRLWIYNQITPPIEEYKEVFIIWSEDSSRSGLIVDGECWGIFDLSAKRKLNAPREDNAIVSIKKEIWDNDIAQNQGEILKLDKI